VLDSCHSGALSGPDFKPGPMGDRSFGQLSYDKGMLVLVATQSENFDWGTLELGDQNIQFPHFIADLSEPTSHQYPRSSKSQHSLTSPISLSRTDRPSEVYASVR
jgi:hypothetical protein